MNVYNEMRKPNDELYTEYKDILTLIDYLINDDIINESKIIWCPFDTAESNFVKILKEKKFNVIYSHIDNGLNFFDYLPECDIIISNPPFSRRSKLFDRLFELNKPFILLQPVQLFNNRHVLAMIEQRQRHISLLLPRKRMNFIGRNDFKHTTAFYSFWLYYDLSYNNGLSLNNLEEQKK